MTIRLWGVRGSIPSPGPETARYGGNTTCVSLEIDPQHTLILDAGTGIRRLGLDRPPGPHTWFILLTHPHWDHIQGLPFFGPRMDPAARIVFLCPEQPAWAATALDQLDGLRFPVRNSEMAAHIEVMTGETSAILEALGVRLSWIRSNHPGICYGYRVDVSGFSFVFMPDNEIGGPPPNGSTWDQLVEFVRGADLLLHDAQYTDSEMADRRGWGHSAFVDACDLACAADVRRLLLFHHDPERTDAQMDALVEDARARVATKAGTVLVDAAREGHTISTRRM